MLSPTEHHAIRNTRLLERDHELRFDRDVVRELDPKDGTTKWEVDLTAELERQVASDHVAPSRRVPEDSLAVLLVADDVVVASHMALYAGAKFALALTAFSRASGARVWSRKLPPLHGAPLTLAGGLLFVIIGGNLHLRLTAIRLVDGEVAFVFPFEALTDGIITEVLPVRDALLLLWRYAGGASRLMRIENP